MIACLAGNLIRTNRVSNENREGIWPRPLILREALQQIPCSYFLSGRFMYSPSHTL